MEINERLIEQLITKYTVSTMLSIENKFNEAYDGFKEEFLNLKYSSEEMSLIEKSERIKYLRKKICNMKMSLLGSTDDQQQSFYSLLKQLDNEVMSLEEEIQQKVNNDKQLPF